jgi:CBS domain-containing protein
VNAADVMTGELLSVRPDTSIVEAIRVMLDHRISGLPVIDDAGRLIGVLTEGDLLRRSETGTERHRPRWLEILMGPGRMAGEYVRTHGRKVGEIMTREVVSVTPERPLDEIVALMERHRIKRVPVLDGDRLVGLVTRADLLRALARTLEEKPAPPTSDDEIRERILAELAKVAWAPRDGLAITVENGVVGLDGVILEEKERQALRVAAENVPGVRAVEDRLVWVEPVSGTIIDAAGETPARGKPPAGNC